MISAYKTAAAEAIANNEIIEEVVKNKISLQFDYLAMNDVMRLVKELDLEIKNQKFDNTCNLELMIRESLLEEFLAKVDDLEKVQLID